MTLFYAWLRERVGAASPLWARGQAGALVAAMLVVLLGQVTPLPFHQPSVAHAEGCPTPYLHTAGAQILDACGQPVTLHALNWYGFDSNDFAAGGLHYWSYKTVVNRIKSLGYNALRIPFSNELVERDPVVSALSSICVQQSCVPVPGTSATPLTGAYLLAAANDSSANNADLVGLDALSILKTIVDYAGQQGLYVILDDHRSEAAWGPEEDGLWYTNSSCPAAVTPFTCYAPQSWLNDWATLGHLFQGDPNVIGMDLRNEPHWVNPTVSGGAARWQPSSCALYVQYAHWGPCTSGQSTWQNNDTDWAQAATQAGNILLGDNPRWLVFVEGGSTYPQPDGSFSQDSWGENLQGAVTDPINLQVAHQLVYSTHDYRWYQTNDTVANMYANWTRNFGFITVPGQPYTTPLWIGEFGTCTHINSCVLDISTGNDAGWWFSTFVNYLQNGDPTNSVPGGMSWSYWPVNGTYSNSWDYTNNDWRTCYGQREDYGVLGGDWSTLASSLLQSMLLPPSPTPTPATATATSTASVPPTGSPTATTTVTGTATITPTISSTVTPTATNSASATATATGTTATATPSPSATDTATGTPTATSEPSATATPSPSVTPQPPTQWPSYTCVPYSTAPTTGPTAIPTTVSPPPATPTNTPPPPAATETPVPPATPTRRPASPTATATPGVVPTVVVCPVLPLDWRLPRGSVASGDVLTLRLHTGSRARVSVALRVEVSRTVTTGTGRHRRHMTQRHVAYQAQSHGVADTHGSFTSRVRIQFKPTKAVLARLSATVQRGCGATSGKAKVTITPPPPLTVSVAPASVASGGRLTVEARTVPRASVTARVQVVKTVVVVTGKGRRRHRITRTTTLYQGAMRGVANAHGHFSGVLRIAYKPSHPVTATLTISAVTVHQGTATYTAHVTIRPSHATRPARRA